MDFRRGDNPGGHQSFYKSGVLPKDDAACSARASFPDLFERVFSNRARRSTFDSAFHALRHLGNYRAFNCGLSGEYLYGNEREFISRI